MVNYVSFIRTHFGHRVYTHITHNHTDWALPTLWYFGCWSKNISSCRLLASYLGSYDEIMVYRGSDGVIWAGFTSVYRVAPDRRRNFQRTGMRCTLGLDGVSGFYFGGFWLDWDCESPRTGFGMADIIRVVHQWWSTRLCLELVMRGEIGKLIHESVVLWVEGSRTLAWIMFYV